MIGVHRRLRDEGRRSRLVLQIHDELLFEVADGETAARAALVREEMSGAYPLDPAARRSTSASARPGWTRSELAQISGATSALPARRGDEHGTLPVDRRRRAPRGSRRRAVPAGRGRPSELDGAMGVATGSVQIGRRATAPAGAARVRPRSATAAASSRPRARASTPTSCFALSHHPPEGGFCRHCGAELVVDVVAVITPPDGGVIGTPAGRCTRCDS